MVITGAPDVGAVIHRLLNLHYLNNLTESENLWESVDMRIPQTAAAAATTTTTTTTTTKEMEWRSA